MAWWRALPALRDGACRVFLCRHARTRLNQSGCVQGLIDEPIDELGMAQAAQLGRAFEGVPLDAVVASTLKRAIATGEHIHHAGGAVQEAGFNEMAFGGIDGTSPEDAHTKEVIAVMHTAWRAGDRDAAFPDGESYEDVSRRSRAALDALVLAHAPGQVAVVSHGRLLSVLLSDILSVGPPGVFDLQLPNCGVAVVDAEPRPGRQVAYHRVADRVVDHLDEGLHSSGFPQNMAR